jgi:hypothetical protein
LWLTHGLGAAAKSVLLLLPLPPLLLPLPPLLLLPLPSLGSGCRRYELSPCRSA